MVRLLKALTDSSQLSVETSFFPDRAPETHEVLLTAPEIQAFQQILAAHPFGSNQEHSYFLESLSESAGEFICSVRITLSGSRQRQQIKISAATYDGLQQVLDRNIVSDGYVHG